MKKLLFAVFCMCFAFTALSAQDFESFKDNAEQSFKDFKASKNKEFNKFTADKEKELKELKDGKSKTENTPSGKWTKVEPQPAIPMPVYNGAPASCEFKAIFTDNDYREYFAKGVVTLDERGREVYEKAFYEIDRWLSCQEASGKIPASSVKRVYSEEQRIFYGIPLRDIIHLLNVEMARTKELIETQVKINVDTNAITGTPIDSFNDKQVSFVVGDKKVPLFAVHPCSAALALRVRDILENVLENRIYSDNDEQDLINVMKFHDGFTCPVR
ncbi:hypothetical protein Dip510_002058 [Elusimicrobium posterum]|uniref:hypothetical protein n=1 Tax=Elusimicrobium posterum TaxID=3116653 RepID=UPI003C775251